MSKKVTIPTCMDPFIVMVNGVKYSYPAGQEVEVPDDVALVIERHWSKHERKPSGTQTPFTGGGGVDVTAQVGQTIMVKEVDSNGKPTKWEAVDYQPRTHWTEEVVILPETTLAVEGMSAFPEIEYMYVAGKDYKVTYNGTEYLCTAIDLGDGIVAIGNTDLLLDTGDNGMPFASLYEGVLGFVVFDGSTSITVSVAEANHTPIPVQYVTNALPYYIEVTGSGKTDDPYVCNDTVANVTKIYNSGRQLVISINKENGTENGTLLFPIVLVGKNDYGVVCAAVISTYMVSLCGFNYIQLVEQENGTFAVTTRVVSAD